jgi:hypothetical protein
MLFKFLIKVFATLLVVAALAPAVSAAPASAPTPPSSALPTARVPAPNSGQALPAAIQAATALRQSLSASQRSAIASIMQAHKASLASVSTALPTSPPSRATLNAARVEQASLLASVESDITKVLNASQKAQYEAGLRAVPTPAATSGVVSRAVVSDATYTPDCSNAESDGTYGWDYSTWGYDWAYDNYFYEDGSSDAYSAYYYAWYAANEADNGYPLIYSNPPLASSEYLFAGSDADEADYYANLDYATYGTYDGYYSAWDNYDASWYDYYAYKDLAAC